MGQTKIGNPNFLNENTSGPRDFTINNSDSIECFSSRFGALAGAVFNVGISSDSGISFILTLIVDQMLARRVLTPRLGSRACAGLPSTTRPAFTQIRYASQAEVEDPGMNGGYSNPPAQKRQFRDPYGEWWDKQDRRNFGEPVHEDNDILTTFSTESYNHFKAPKAFMLLGISIASVFAFSGVVSFFYPDKPSVPRTFEDGLVKELGGVNAVRARIPGEGSW
ncbi:hypothetical protein LOZ66_004887 [Ophidiomyces ophidiicola]|nr:hypothetical protein LOZ66_004887 [Ophidiomyces ophidiicola]